MGMGGGGENGARMMGEGSWSCHVKLSGSQFY